MGNTTHTNFTYNFSSIPSNRNYTLSVRGWDSYDVYGVTSNIHIFVIDFAETGIFFNFTLNPMENYTLEVYSPFVFNITTSGSGNLNFTSSCHLYMNGTDVANVTPSFGLVSFPSVVLYGANWTWNVSCLSGNVPSNSPQLWILNSTAVFSPNASGIFSVESCTIDTTAEVLFVALFFILGLTLIAIAELMGIAILGVGIFGGLALFSFFLIPCSTTMGTVLMISFALLGVFRMATMKF